MIEGEVKIAPISLNSAYRGRRFNTPEKIVYERAVLLSLQKPKIALLGDLELELVLFLKHPKRNDLDNLCKIQIDLLQKRGFFKNDNQVVSLIARKEQADVEGWKFSISEVEL